MDEKTAKTDFFEQLSGEWMETTSRFWNNAFQMQNEWMLNVPSFWKFYTDSFSKSG